MDIQYLNGADGIKTLFERTLHNKEKILRTVLTESPLVYLAGKDFSDRFIADRIKAMIFVKSLRLSSSTPDVPEQEKKSSNFKEIKTAPKDLSINDSLVIWDDFVAIVNTKKMSCILIKNAKNAAIMKNWFDYTWDNLESIKS